MDSHQPYQCSQCTNQEHLKLCARCRIARYCGPDCQKAVWKKHKHRCVDPSARVSASVVALEQPVNPALPSNPLGLRTQPTTTDADKEAISGGMFALLLDAVNDPLGAAAIDGDRKNRKSENLYKGTSEEIMSSLKTWVYDRLRAHDQAKAIRITSQSVASITLPTLRIMTMMSQGKMPLDTKLPPNWLLLAAESDQLDEAAKYMDQRAGYEHYKGDWLYKSLIHALELPADHGHSRFPNAQSKPDSYIIATLLALGVQGVDEGMFWELEDWQDELKLRANAAALQKIQDEIDLMRGA